MMVVVKQMAKGFNQLLQIVANLDKGDGEQERERHKQLE
jgi:hypothetical protein